MKYLLRGLLLIGSFSIFFALAEVLYAWLVPATNIHHHYRTYYRDADHHEITYAEAAARQLVVPAEPSPRPRPTWSNGLLFYLCYTGARQDYFDADGCVANRINSCGIRDREELCAPKAPGERRIVCVGDSFTFGWGVRVEHAWPRLVEERLRATDDGIRTVNCGAAGAIYLDEYAMSLRERFWRFEPDVVLVTLCLNDLIPSSNALLHTEPPAWIFRNSRILGDLFAAAAARSAMRIDPDRDLTAELLALPEAFYPEWARPEPPINVGREPLWPGGGAQRALLEMRDHCAEHAVTFGVVLWPYFQGLGPGEHYPFTGIHRLVADFCRDEGIAFLDLLPRFAGVRPTEDWWVSPADAHGDEEAHAHAVEPLTAFAARLLEQQRGR